MSHDDPVVNAMGLSFKEGGREFQVNNGNSHYKDKPIILISFTFHVFCNTIEITEKEISGVKYL